MMISSQHPEAMVKTSFQEQVFLSRLKISKKPQACVQMNSSFLAVFISLHLVIINIFPVSVYSAN